MGKRGILFIATLLTVAFIALAQNNTFAETIAIAFTGETHSNLYPCSCQPELGGLSRRMTTLNELRKKYKDLLLLDSGGVFAGGVLDRYSPDPNMSIKRTSYNMKAVKLMNYDAIAIGDEELNLGADNLQGVINDTGIPFLSANAQNGPAQPYIIKKINNISIGIIGLSPAENSVGVQTTDPIETAKKIVSKLKAENVNIIIILSHLGQDRDPELAKNVKDVDIIISSHMLTGEEPMTTEDKIFILRPSFEGKRLGLFTANFTSEGLKEQKCEYIPLDEKVANDPQIDMLLPKCCANFDCRKKDFEGECLRPGEIDSECIFREVTPVTLTIITPKDCVTCNTKYATAMIQTAFPKLTVVNLDDKSAQGRELIEKYKLTGMPAFLLGKEIVKSMNFNKIKDGLKEEENHYLVLPSTVGMSYFASRQKIANRIDVVLNIYSPEAAPTLKLVKEVMDKNAGKFNFEIYIVIPKMPNQPPDAPENIQQKEELLRQLAVKKYYPKQWWDYALCRMENPESSWWDSCISKAGIDMAKIKACATGQEGQDLLEKNNAFTKELGNPAVSVILLDNQEIFGVSSQTTAAELERIILRN